MESNNENEEVDSDMRICCFCNLDINLVRKECSICFITAHIECLENYNSEWDITEEQTLICKQCSAVNRLAYADSI